MAMISSSTRLLAVVHVGSVSGVLCSSSQTPQQETVNNKYELNGAAIDVCRQILTETTVYVMEPYAVKVTNHAVDTDGRGSFESLTLVLDSTCLTVGNGNTSFTRFFYLLDLIPLRV